MIITETNRKTLGQASDRMYFYYCNENLSTCAAKSALLMSCAKTNPFSAKFSCLTYLIKSKMEYYFTHSVSASISLLFRRISNLLITKDILCFLGCYPKKI